MSLLFSLLMKMDAGQAKAELRALQTEMKKAGGSAKVLGTDAKAAGAGVDQLGDKSAEAVGKVAALSDAKRRAAASSTTLKKGLDDVQKGGFLAGNSARLFSQQLSQVGQQTMATGHFVQALAIQLPDIGIGFGAVGGAVGLLAGIALPLLVSAFGSAKAGALSAEDAVGEFSSALDDYKGFVALSATSTAELTARFGDFAGEVRGFAEYMQGVSLGIVLTSMDAAIEPLKGKLAGVEAALNQVQVAKENLNRTQLLVDQGLESPMAVLAAKDALELFEAKAEETAASMGLLPQQARELATAIDELGTARGVAQIRDEAADALALIQAWYPAGAALTPELATAVSYLNEIVTKAGEASSSTDDAGAAAARLELTMQGAYAVYAATRGVAAGLANETERAARAQFAFAQQSIAAAGKVYSGRGGDPRTSNSQGEGRFVYNGPSLDPYNNPVANGGAGSGGGAARAEADAVGELITKLREEQEVRGESDPVQQEMLKYRKQLADATAAERAEVENLIRAEQQLKAIRAVEDFASQSMADFLDAIIVKGASAQDALRGLLSSLIKVGIQALMLGQGPLAGIFGIQGGLFSSLLGGGLQARAAGGLITGEGGPRADKVALWGSAGEFMVTGRATARYRPVLERMNAGLDIAGFADGGMVGGGRAGVARAGGGFPGGQASGRGGLTQQININGANGNTEIREMVAQGIQAGLAAYDREVLGKSVHRVLRDGRVSG